MNESKIKNGLMNLPSHIINSNIERLSEMNFDGKEKVLFILNKLITSFGNNIVLSYPIQDLQWCYFIIENDYLQISNSISCKKDYESLQTITNSDGNTEDNKKQAQSKLKGDRRFSKTISSNFGTRNRD